MKETCTCPSNPLWPNAYSDDELVVIEDQVIHIACGKPARPDWPTGHSMPSTPKHKCKNCRLFRSPCGAAPEKYPMHYGCFKWEGRT